MKRTLTQIKNSQGNNFLVSTATCDGEQFVEVYWNFFEDGTFRRIEAQKRESYKQDGEYEVTVSVAGYGSLTIEQATLMNQAHLLAVEIASKL